jgi:hypothetical protein
MVTKSELITDKTKNFIEFLRKEFPNTPLPMIQFETMTPEQILLYVSIYVLPQRGSLNKMIEEVMTSYKIKKEEYKPEIINKMIRYLEFYCDMAVSVC